MGREGTRRGVFEVDRRRSRAQRVLPSTGSCQDVSLRPLEQRPRFPRSSIPSAAEQYKGMDRLCLHVPHSRVSRKTETTRSL